MKPTEVSPEHKLANPGDYPVLLSEIKERIRSMFRLDESLDAFYSLCRRENGLRWIPRIGGGRMLRSATGFEDIVKMICTTNCSWHLTVVMVRALVETFGRHVQGLSAFPRPGALRCS